MPKVVMKELNVLYEKTSRAFNRKSIRFGVPFLILVLGGSFGLKEFAQIRYQFARHQPINPEDVEKKGGKMKQPGEVTLETEFEKIKKLDIDNWTQTRGPRPWE